MVLGATEYLIKPVDSEQLIKLIRSYMQRDSRSDHSDNCFPGVEDDSIRWIEAQLRF
jgi:response regulator of citrate/malate metabolism